MNKIYVGSPVDTTQHMPSVQNQVHIFRTCYRLDLSEGGEKSDLGFIPRI